MLRRSKYKHRNTLKGDSRCAWLIERFSIILPHVHFTPYHFTPYNFTPYHVTHIHLPHAYFIPHLNYQMCLRLLTIATQSNRKES